MNQLPTTSVFSRHLATAACLSAGVIAAVGLISTLAFAPSAAQAKMYKIVGPDGKVTYTDRPPAAKSKGKVKDMDTRSAKRIRQLPTALRKPAAKHPVVLYSTTTGNCNGCAVASDFLRQRGIPHSTWLVETKEDTDAMKKKTNSNALPLLKIGNKQIEGFQREQWNEYLTAAEYPENSALPANYTFSKPRKLTTPKPVKAQAKAKEPTAEELRELEIRQREEKALSREPGDFQF